MSAFEDFVSLELPRRPVMLTAELCGYAGDPNDVGAPSIVQNSPKGTFYLRGSDNTLWKKNLATPGSWEQVASGGGGGGAQTSGDIDVTVDYNDPTAVDAPADIGFTTQAQIDAFLLTNGATAFKHLDRFYEALAPVKGGQIYIHLAAGVHRPSGLVSNIAWALGGKVMAFKRESDSNKIYVTIFGAPTSQWTGLVGSFAAPLSVVSVDNGTVSRNPSVTFAGTPFLGQDLKGRFCILNTGQVSPIHDHNDSTLFLLPNISPVPTSGWVGLPSTILRNSLNDVTPAVTSGTKLEWRLNTQGFARMYDVMVQPFGSAGNGIGTTDGSVRFIRCIVDERIAKEVYGRNPDGVAFFGGIGTLAMEQSIYTSPPGIGGSDGVVWVSTGLVSMTDFYGRQSESSVVRQNAALFMHRAVFEGCGGGDGQLATINVSNSMIYPQSFAPLGKPNEIRAAFYSGIAGIALLSSELYRSGSDDVTATYENLVFKGVKGDCIIMRDGSAMSTKRSSYGFRDGGGNLGVGLRLDGLNSCFDFGPLDDVAGALGAVKFADGTILSHAQIQAAGVVTDDAGNIVRRT